ncbi:LysR family transcriptional regulator ArgP [Pacificibacter marinus]|uniref:LysR family transcriptional regulator ArgP n=1 Tax=Pacificibacter marinus TaxID=658057 RepID=UPI001C07C194|nr:LysR family transcriptional regulator ArgP [Pacificibacter marinus]MBU2868871.1 LysR family transcriptional regulator ArgP [Pacificibacter marinus]
MLDYASLDALAAVLRGGSFDHAAKMLGVTPSAISQRIKALEERHGCALVIRGTPCTGTDIGKRLARHAEDVGLLEAELSQDIFPNAATPKTVRIAVNADSLATWFVDALAPVEGLMFDLEIDDQDTAGDWLKRGEVAAAVSSHAGPIAGCDSFALGAQRYRATASPDFAAKHFQQGITAHSLSAAPAMIYSAKDQLQDTWVERHIGRKLALPHHRLPSTQAFLDGAIVGLGWGLNPEHSFQAAQAKGQLCELIPDTPLDIDLYWHVSRAVKTPLRGLTASVRKAARAALVQS